MKGKISVWYLILVALGVLAALTIGYVADTIIEDTFTNALGSSAN